MKGNEIVLRKKNKYQVIISKEDSVKLLLGVELK
jgi:hypothetical protein